jgi:hypothetical protein
MSDQNQNPPSPAPTPAPAQSEQEPTWLKPRLEQAERAAERKVLERLGVTDIDAASKAIQAAKAVEEANKSAEQKAAELAAKLTAQQTEAERLAAVTREHAGRMLGVLTAEQQAAVKAIAGEDPAKQLQAITALGPTWSSTPAPPAPVNTAPPAGPPAAEPNSPPDHRAVYESERAKNPFAAAAYGLAHQSEVFKPRS